VVALGNAVESAVDLGRWREADEALATLAEADVSGALAGGIELSAAQLAALRGDFSGADARLEAASSQATTEHVAARTWYLRVRCMVALLRGELEPAWDFGMEAVTADPAGMNTPNAVWDAAHAAIWLRDPARVRQANDATSPMRGRWAAIVKTTIRAGLAALEGRRDEAVDAYREAFAGWETLDSPLDHAYTAIDAITLLPDEPVAVEAADRAREALERLGARPLLERLDAARQPAPADVP
jgi:ATP/maltotriose-dependent transcriptional regulator MalT